MKVIYIEHWQLKQMQNLPLEIKIEKTKQRIKEWYEHWDGQVYISFSGGKDSNVSNNISSIKNYTFGEIHANEIGILNKAKELLEKLK